MRKRREVIYEDSLGQRLGRFLALIGTIFAITTAVVVTQRLSQDALAMVIGMVMVGLPLLALLAGALYVLFRVIQNQRRTSSAPPQQIPIVLQVPQQQPALPDYGGWGDTPARAGSRRDWDLLGDDE